MSFLDRIKSGLAKTRDALNKSLDPVFETLEKVDPTAPELALETDYESMSFSPDGSLLYAVDRESMSLRRFTITG